MAEWPNYCIDGVHKYIKEPFNDLSIYGNFPSQSEGKASLFILRLPNGNLPWSKKIRPAINKLVKSWMLTKEKVRWNIESEGMIFVGKNFYTGTTEPIPETERFWDGYNKYPHYEWNGKELIKVR
jgi:hypothetical protein